MIEYEQSMLLQSPRDTIFDLLMDLSNLPRLVSIVQETKGGTDDQVRIQGCVEGRAYVSAGYVRVVDVLRRMEWGFGVECQCRGWVQVDGDDDAGSARVTAHVSLASEVLHMLSAQRRDETVRAMLAESLAALRQAIDSRKPDNSRSQRVCPCVGSGD
jgi:hypothetical protein